MSRRSLNGAALPITYATMLYNTAMREEMLPRPPQPE